MTSTTLLLSHLGWQTATSTLRAEDYSVREGTQLLLARTALPTERVAQFATFCRTALGAAAMPAAVQQAVTRLPALFTKLWRLRWDNNVKEVFWRLVYDGLPTAACQHRPFSCACDTHSPNRLHHFWACPIAQAVVTALVAQLPSTSILPRSAVWLCVAPGDQHDGAWAVVCLCALAAMERGRREMYRRLCEGQTPGPEFASSLQRHAVARFWELLTDFCAVGAPPPAWRDSIGLSHPFFRFDSATLTWHVRR